MKTTAPRLRHNLCLAACTLLLAGIVALTGTATAATLMFDFGGRTLTEADLTNSPLHAANPTFDDTYWNAPVYNTAGAQSVRYSDNTAATGVSIYVGRSAGGANPWTSITFAGTPSNFLSLAGNKTGVFTNETSIGRDGIRAQSSTPQTEYLVAVAITGLAAGTYDLYLVGINVDAAHPMKFWATEGSLSNTSQPLNNNANNFDASTFITAGPQATSSNNVTDSWSQNSNFVKLSVTLSGEANSYLTIFALGDGSAGGDPRGILNAIQIVSQIPEPATIATFAGLAIFFTAFFIRRIRRNS
ncbi:hypothetical protein OpiT1DRAFT_03352 [Opitutaceae bacterium TAV1]|nr:hypothetical protein OpiT1DRAFT_03352 [Opitutaceae bacterium TAV1]